MKENILRLKKKTNRRKFNWSKFSFIIAHYAIAVIIVLIFYVYANAASLIMAFQRIRNGETYFTLYNFEWFFQEFGSKGTMMKEAFLNTLMWWSLSMVNTIMGVFTSYFIYKKIVGHQVFRILFMLPSLLMPVVLTFCVSRMFSAQGFIAEWVQKKNGLEIVPDLLYDKRFVTQCLIAKHLVFAIASNMLVLVGTMSRIPDSVIESGKIDGANWVVEMFCLVIPMVMPVVGITLCTLISGFFNMDGDTFLYTKGQNGTMTLHTWMYLQVYNTVGESNSHHQASAVGWLMTIIICPVVLWCRKMMNKIGEVEY